MRALLLSPHTDDIEIGAGGTLIKLLQGKDNNFCWVVFSTCENAVPQGLSPDTLRKEFTAVASHVSITNYRIHSFPNMNFPEHRQEILSELDKIKREFEPQLVIAPSLNDSHQDHKTIAEEVIRAFKKDTSIIGYELPWNNLVFSPQLLVKLTEEQMQEKWRILSLYESQFMVQRNYFSKDFIFGWARMRGTQCNAEYAEAFEVTRWVVK
ncbi:MAG: PIG-L family deacetylase [Dehalococcoidia bacterium]